MESTPGDAVRRLVWVLVPVLLLIAAVSTLLILAGRDPAGESDSDGVSGTPDADPVDVAWRRAGSGSFGGGTDLAAVARSAAGFLAVGHDGDTGAIWASPEGESWERVNTGVFGPGEEPTGIGAHMAEVVAVGVAGEVTPLAWISHDAGVTWSRSELPGVALGQVRGVAVSGDASRGAVVGGSTLGERRDAAVWWSADGDVWQAVDDPDLRGEGVDLTILAITETADGFVAVGTENDQKAAVWLSGDGREWERILSDSFVGDGDLSMWGVASGPTGIAAVGHTGGDRIEPAAWFSTDGRTWERAALDVSGDRTMWGVAASTQGWVAVGAAARDTRAALWYSVDGREWTQYEEIEIERDIGSVAVYSVAASDTRFVAVGGVSSDTPATSRGLVLVTS
ncbi:MAG: hypothetical protein IT198_10930 [Acidimicrobiia bacterium]|nr:hypothetical protein [Acidimicrobiia bacterium]